MGSNVTTTDPGLGAFLQGVRNRCPGSAGSLTPSIVPRSDIRLWSELVSPGQPVGAPIYLWVPVKNLDLLVGGSRGQIKGTLNALRRANEGRSGIMRTAALLWDEKHPLRRDVLMILAALVSLIRQMPTLEAAYRSLVTESIAVLGVRTPLELWHNRMQYLLPAMPPDLADFASTNDALADRIGIWFAALRSDNAITLALPVASDRSYFPTVAQFSSAMDDIAQETSRNEVPGTAEWHAISPEDLEKLVWTVPRKVLEARLGVSRTSISEKCSTFSIPQPPVGFWGKKKAGFSTDALLEKAGIDTAYGCFDA